MSLKSFSLLVGVAGLLFYGCEKKDTASTSQTNAPSSSGNPITAPVDYLGAAAKAKKSTEKVVVSAGLNQAIKQFYALEGRYPKDLDELATKQYVSSVPKPPVGMKFEYNPATGDLKTVPQ